MRYKLLDLEVSRCKCKAGGIWKIKVKATNGPLWLLNLVNSMAITASIL